MSATAAHGSKNLAAASLVRACLADDRETCVLIVEQNGGETAGCQGDELVDLVVAVVRFATWCLLASNGYDVGKALAVADQRMGIYARDEL